MLRRVGDSSGVAAVEYAVLLALILLVCMGTVKTIGLAWNAAKFAKLTDGIGNM